MEREREEKREKKERVGETLSPSLRWGKYISWEKGKEVERETGNGKVGKGMEGEMKQEKKEEREKNSGWREKKRKKERKREIGGKGRERSSTEYTLSPAQFQVITFN